MAHELETFADGTTAFVSREDAWHSLGTVLDRQFTAEEAMTHAKLGGWNVRKKPLEVVFGNGQRMDMPGKFATVRTNPVTKKPEPLGVVGEWYTPIQNEEHCELLNTLVDESGAHFDTAGSLRDGREVFVTMELPDHMTVGGVDQYKTYIAALNSHDGSSAFRLLLTPVRIVCANTQAAALRGAKSTFPIRHTASASQALGEAREALGLSFKYMESFQAELERMINKPLREVDFVNKIRRLMPFKEMRLGKAQGAQAKKAYEAKIAICRDLFSNAQTNANIRGTNLCGYEAWVEYLDFFSPVAVAKDQLHSAVANQMRAEKALTKKSIIEAKERGFASFAVSAK